MFWKSDCTGRINSVNYRCVTSIEIFNFEEGFVRHSSIKLLALFAVLLFVFGTINLAPLSAQTETGTIAGTVTDQSGAVIPKAKVTVKNAGTGAQRDLDTDERGIYNVSNLLPGQYVVTAQAPNLATQERHVQLTVGSRTEVNFQLTVSAAAATVEVVAEGGVAVNTETATLGVIADSATLEKYPSLTRNPYDFASTAPTASDSDPSGRGVGVAFNGLRSASTNILLDGTANNDEFTATVGQVVPMDSVQEYSVLTNNFGAEYGRAAAGVVNLATRYGTNDIHGSIYEYNRVSALASNDFNSNANSLDKASFVRNVFGGRVGGPIYKDKLFYFANVEFNRIRSNQNQITMVMDPAFIAMSDPAIQSFYSQYGVLRPGANVQAVDTMSQVTSADPCTLAPVPLMCPSMGGTFDPTVTPFMDRVSYSVPGDSGAGAPQNQAEIFGRVDWNVNSKTTVYSRYAMNKASYFDGWVSNSAYAGYDTGENIMQNNFMISVTRTLSPRVTSQSKIVFNRLFDLQPLGKNAITPNLYISAGGTGRAAGLPVTLPGYLPYYPGSGIPFGGPQNFLQAYQDFSWSKGRHTLRFGGSYDYQRDNRSFGAYEEPIMNFRTGSSVTWNARSLNNFMNGVAAQFQGAVYPQGKYPCPDPIYTAYYGTPQCLDANAYFNNGITNEISAGEITTPASPPVFARSNRYHEFAFYGSDQWKISNRLNVTLGLRWEYFGVQHNKNPNMDSNFYMGSGGSIFDQIRNGSVMTTPQSPIGGLWAKDWNNFAPKLGFAYDVFGNGKTVVRGGYSIAYERNFGNVTFNVIQNPPNYAVVSVTAGLDIASIPVTTDPMGPLSGAGSVLALPKTSLRAVNPNIRTAFAHLVSLTVEHEIRRNLVVGIDYSGSYGEKLYDISNINKAGSGNYYKGDTCTDYVDAFGGGTYPCGWIAFGILTNPYASLGLPYVAPWSGWRDQFTRILNNQYSNINYRSDGGKSHYNALVARGTVKNLANTGLTMGANYTWSHTMDRLSDTFSSSGNNFNLGYLDPFNAKVDYGNSYMDLRHRFALSANWEAPFGKGKTGWQKYVEQGWTLAPVFTAETGSPFSIYDCSMAYTVCMYAVNAAGTALPRTGTPVADLSLPNYYNYISFSNSSSVPYFDSSYYDPITGLSDYGPYPANMNARNVFRGPGQWHFDLAAEKAFKFRERFELLLRAEAYNIFNHANMFVNSGDADVSVGPTGFVDAYKQGRRHMQLSLRLNF
jgi:outer membrane receptor protein involved in Fe transport